MAGDSAKTTPKKQSGKVVDTSWHARFLEVFAQSLNVKLACRGAGVDRATAYIHRKRFPEFDIAWKSAKKSAIEELEAEAWKRAKNQSDLLIIFLLKSHKPKRYRERVDQKQSGELILKVQYGDDGSQRTDD